jgi:hypothetical protein
MQKLTNFESLKDLIMTNKILTITTFLLFSCQTFSQNLKPGFDYDEYILMLQISAHQGDTPWTDVNIDYPQGFRLDYRSAEMALLNRWDLWISEDSTVVISIRGTVGNFNSWLENFYSAMVPASGTLQLSENDFFNYKLSSHPKAAVHVGWLLATAYMAPEIKQKMDSCLYSGYKDFIIMGHSQGGAIAYLITAWVLNEKLSSHFASDFTLKTYCSAAPKPGNIYFAYEYEYLTQNGWAYNVINAADWVPETPFTIQTLQDFNDVNPFSDKKSALKSQGFFARIVMGHAYNKINRPLNKSLRKFQKYLGNKTYKFVKKSLPNFENPEYASTNYYVRAGNIIVLYPDSAYNKIYSENPKHKFVHHMILPYLYLAEKQRDELKNSLKP